MNQDNKHSVNLIDLFAQFKASVFSRFGYRLSYTVSVSYILKGGKHYDQSGITKYVYSRAYQYVN